MPNFYCEYCGTKSSSISSLTANSCHRHPLGAGKGKHKLYEGRKNLNTVVNIVALQLLAFRV